jgi:hypothetical protein
MDHRRALQRLHVKQQTVAALIEGRLDLVEAAVQFRAAGLAPQPEDGEALCRSLIGWVHLALRDRPERAEALSEELENELQTHLARHGAVRLPRT